MIAFQSKPFRSLGSHYVGLEQCQTITILRECNAQLKTMAVLCKVSPIAVGKGKKAPKGLDS